MKLAKKVLLVGWDAADWQIIDPLIVAGKMPTLARLIKAGVRGNLSTIRPILSPMLWNSIATGKRADKHGILGFIEPKPDGTGIQPTSSTTRKCKGFWNILTQRGMSVNVVNWYASHPAEPINGVVVTEEYPRVHHQAEGPTPLPSLSVFPESLRDTLADLRVSPEEMTGHHLAPFVPTLGEIPAEETPPVTGLRRFLARAASTHAAATYLLEHNPADVTAVYYEAIDHTSHGFMQYHPPRAEHIDPALFARYSEVINGMYRFHDMMLERLIQLAGEETTVILCSDHGFVSDASRPVETKESPISPAAWHRFHGMIVMAGNGLRKDHQIHGASILDVTPTLLTMLDLPVGEDMDGRVIYDAFEITPKVATIPSWEAEPGEAGLHPKDLRVDPYEQQAAMAQLVELGYIDRPSDDAATAIKVANTESKYNLACAELDAQHFDRAIALFRELLAADSDDRSREGLFKSLMAIKHLDEAREVLEGMPAVQKLLEHERVSPGSPFPAEIEPELMANVCTIDLLQGRKTVALTRLDQLKLLKRQSVYFYIHIGNLFLGERLWSDAKPAFEAALACDLTASEAYYGLGVAQIHLGDLTAAADNVMQATNLIYMFPKGHFVLGMILARMGLNQQAIKSFELALKLRPGIVTAHRYLAVLYMRIGDVDRTMYHRKRNKELYDLAVSRLPQRTSTADQTDVKPI